MRIFISVKHFLVYGWQLDILSTIQCNQITIGYLNLKQACFLESSTAGGGGADSAPLCNFLI